MVSYKIHLLTLVPDGSTLTFSGHLQVVLTISLCTSLSLLEVLLHQTAENKGNFKAGGLFRTNAQNLTANTTILATENAQVTGVLTVDSGVTLSVNSGGRLVIS